MRPGRRRTSISTDGQTGWRATGLFVHKDRQGRGIASALLAELEAEAGKAGFDLLTTQASRIAKPFFLSRGFVLLAAQRVECRGLRIENFRMEKCLAL